MVRSKVLTVQNTVKYTTLRRVHHTFVRIGVLELNL